MQKICWFTRKMGIGCALLSAACLMVCAVRGEDAEVAAQLRAQGSLYLQAADTLDARAATIATQAARISALEALVADLRGDLKPANFAFLGRASVSVGMACGGLAHDPVTGWWYTVGQAGNPPFNLYRFRLPAPNAATVQAAAQVELIGAINNPADVLKMAGQALVGCKGLLWEGNDTLLVNYGSYYANGNNTNFLARYNVVSKSITGGPWMVEAAISSERTKGMTLVAPPALARATGRPLMSFGVIGSTPQLQSWGLGLVALDRPVASPVPATVVAHWPMKIWPGSNPIIPFSDYPGDAAYALMYLQRAADGSVVKTPMTGNSRFHGGCFIGDKHLIAFGNAGHGHTWYGNKDDYADVPSLLDPTKPTTSVSAARGGHVEANIDKWWLFRVDDIASKFAAGDKLISHYATGRVATLGGTVPLQSTAFGQAVYVDGRLYVICSGGPSPQILTWSVP